MTPDVIKIFRSNRKRRIVLLAALAAVSAVITPVLIFYPVQPSGNESACANGCGAEGLPLLGLFLGVPATLGFTIAVSLDFFRARADLKKKLVAWAFGTFSIIQETRRGRFGNEISHCTLIGCPGEDLDVDCGVAFVVSSYATSSTSDRNPFGGGSSSYTFEGSVQYVPDSGWLLRIGVDPDHLVYEREGLEQISNNPPGRKSLGYVVPDVRRRLPTSDNPDYYPNPDDSG